MQKQWTNLKGFIFFSIIFIFVLSADILLVYGYYRFAQHFLLEQPEKISADAGVIFFGDYNDRGTQLGPDSENRAKAAIHLFNKGMIESIVCVGGYDIHRRQGKPHVMKKFLLKHGVPETCIFHDSLSFNTITNWQEACKIINKEQFKKVVAISAPLHLYRISTIIDSNSVVYHAYSIKFESFTDYWQIFKDVHREWISRILSIALKDKLRNRIVHFYRTIRFEVDRVI